MLRIHREHVDVAPLHEEERREVVVHDAFDLQEDDVEQRSQLERRADVLRDFEQRRDLVRPVVYALFEHAFGFDLLGDVAYDGEHVRLAAVGHDGAEHLRRERRAVLADIAGAGAELAARRHLLDHLLS